jgi:deoxyribose-phosphate aldolase
MQDIELAKLIDHTNVRPDATEFDIIKLCEEAISCGFASACVCSCWVPFVRKRFDSKSLRLCAVAGFPFGATIAGIKELEAKKAVSEGADEIDAVMNIGFLKSGKLDLVSNELSGIVSASGNATVKVIIETCYLNDEEKILASSLVKEAGADFVKTSTGYGPSGASLEDIKIIKNKVAGIKIKASGGIRTFEDAKKFIDAGASRIGTSAGPKIIGKYGR